MSNELLNNALVNIIDKVTQGVDAVVAFGVEQIPDILMQLILFNTVWYVIVLVTIPLSFYLCYKLIKYVYNKTKPEIGGNPVRGAVNTVVICWVTAGVIIFGSTMYDFTKITLAPKIWLIEYASDLAKDVKK